VNNGYVALTFDDGPNPASTPALLAALAEHQARATFFIWGAHALRHPEHLRAVHDAGMWLGNHSHTHPYLTRAGRAAVLEEISGAQLAVRKATGLLPTLFRPPYGDTDDGVRAAAAEFGLTEVLWSVDTRDWAGVSADEIVEAAGAVEPGGVILMHDGGYPTTVEAVPRILRMLAARGLRPGRIAGRPAGGVVVTAP
jgi:peptidoglycan/xylan/chitin deacetylase (PgdA/CDA1 family)